VKIKPALLIFIIVIALLFNCGKSDETYTIEIKDGVKYIHNHTPLWGDTLKVALEFVQKIGELDGDDENYLLYKPYDLVRDADENTYILDNGNYRIQKFDRNGKYLATIGRKGQGPGEFGFSKKLEMDSKGNLYVADLNGCLILTNDGKEINRIVFLREFSCVTRAGNILNNTSNNAAENIARDCPLISLYDADGNFIKAFGERKDYGDRLRTLFGNYYGLYVDKDDNIYAAFDDQNRIEKYSPGGNLIFRTDRPINIELGVDEEHSIIFEPGRGILSFYRLTAGIGIDHKNRIWVKTYKKLKEEGDNPTDYFELEIFDNDGILLGNLPIPQNFNYMRIFQDLVYLIDRDEEMCVYEYKIVEK